MRFALTTHKLRVNEKRPTAHHQWICKIMETKRSVLHPGLTNCACICGRARVVLQHLTMITFRMKAGYRCLNLMRLALCVLIQAQAPPPVRTPLTKQRGSDSSSIILKTWRVKELFCLFFISWAWKQFSNNAYIKFSSVYMLRSLQIRH